MSDICDKCSGQGHYPITGQRCHECKGAGWLEDEDDLWYADDFPEEE